MDTDKEGNAREGTSKAQANRKVDNSVKGKEKGRRNLRGLTKRVRRALLRH